MPGQIGPAALIFQMSSKLFSIQLAATSRALRNALTRLR
jgi:hypothetical protein